MKLKRYCQNETKIQRTSKDDQKEKIRPQKAR
jgi:hypothetical protein